MKIQRKLRGKPKGAISAEDLLVQVQHLSGETVNINKPGLSASGVIIEQWHFDGDTFEIQFSEMALEFLQAADDPRIEIVDLLFNEIG